jgi:hypothetical protein
MTVFDELAETDGDEEFQAWLSKLIDAKQEVVDFVSSCCPGHPIGVFDGYLKGSFNLNIIVKLNEAGPRAVIRFLKPGHTARSYEKRRLEMKYKCYNCLPKRRPSPYRE